MENSSFYKGDFSKNNMIAQKRGQVTIFIILAIIIVVTIIVFFSYSKLDFLTSSQKGLYIESCIEKELQNSISELALSAGQIKPMFTTMYVDENISVICYTGEYNKPCVVQDPFLKQTFEDSLKKIMKSKIESCYETGIEELKSRGYDVVSGKLNYNININPDKTISVNLTAPTSISSDSDTTARVEKFEITIASNLYEVISVANSILQFETYYGDAEASSFMLYYPDLKIEKIRRDEGMKIYVITDGEIKYRFASRSYAWPAGYGING